MSEVAVSVIIPALNAATTLGAQLRALGGQEFGAPWEVVVVDNGSTDRTIEVCHEHASLLPSLRVVTCPVRGTSAARNRGAAESTAGKLLFCDADDEVAPGWLAALAAALEHHDAAGGAIENDKLNDANLPLPRHPDHLPVVAGFLPRAITANLGVRRSVFDDIGGFDEAYDYGGPDTEFCWRLQLASYTLAYAPDAVVHYQHRQTLRSTAVKAYKTGRSRGRLSKDYAAHGMPRPRLVGTFLRWGRLIATLPAVPFSQTVRWRWVEDAASAAGRVRGSVQHRVRYL